MAMKTIKSLYQDAKDRFDLQAMMIQPFLTLIFIRLQMVGNVILNVLGRNLCQCHGEHTLDQMKTKAMTYINTHTRQAQDDDTFATMLWNCITDAATAVMALKTEDFTIIGVTSGLLLVKSLLIHSKVDTVNDPGLIHRKMTKALHFDAQSQSRHKKVQHSLQRFG
jgi:hypothetical protein